ncbi:helix-turn-helix domain-containing protein [Pigmentiphaga litoralis]|uniref:helix-turn-helix domain-containing protein n=1 Tax=Pigmentiphaga litoralis TaxID=516702 RepID=UPI0016728568|nr:helix-turn-helix domain-containing protein [Pigmentiphaga litoralis]GGX11277.1 helix-turn-helix domain-containing protein [Pigmentiphaga litoralis]
MSIKVMTMVFDRYPGAAGEMLLALALADHASDDGTRVYPSVDALALKTRQSVRSVQYQLSRMLKSGWLVLVNSGNGGRGQHREYRISPAWLKGADIAPIENGAIDATKGANDDAKGCNPRPERVQPVAPAYNRHRTINESSVPQGAKSRTGFDAAGIELPDWLPREAWTTWAKDRKDRRKPITETAAGLQIKQLADFMRAGHSPADVIEHTISRGWTGLVAPERGNAARQTSKRFDPVAHINERDRRYADDADRTIDV